MPYFDRYDVCQAYYLFGRDYHGGQWSKEYKDMCRVSSLGYTPPYNLRESSLSDNAKQIFGNLVRKSRKGNNARTYQRICDIERTIKESKLPIPAWDSERYGNNW